MPNGSRGGRLLPRNERVTEGSGKRGLRTLCQRGERAREPRCRRRPGETGSGCAHVGGGGGVCLFARCSQWISSSRLRFYETDHRVIFASVYVLEIMTCFAELYGGRQKSRLTNFGGFFFFPQGPPIRQQCAESLGLISYAVPPVSASVSDSFLELWVVATWSRREAEVQGFNLHKTEAAREPLSGTPATASPKASGGRGTVGGSKRLRR